MKKVRKIIFCLLAAVLFVHAFAGCAVFSNIFSKTDDSGEFDYNGPFYEAENSGSGIKLAVLPPEGVNLRDRDEYLLDMIYGSLNENFGKFSEMVLLNRKELELLESEQRIQLTHYAESDLSISNFKNFEYILTSKLTSVSQRELSLIITITHLGTGEVKTTYTKLLSIQGLKSGAIGEASLYLLENMGVVLTDNGRKAIIAEAQASADAQAKLARSREAERTGNSIAGLINAYGALERNASLIEAEEQLKLASDAVSTGNLGTDIKNDLEWRDSWLKKLKEFEAYYRDYTPFEIIYTKPNQKGDTDYETRTADFEFYIGIQPSTELKIMQKVLRDVSKDLDKTKRRKKWKFSEWPDTHFEYNLYTQRKYTVEIGLFNVHDEEIKRISVDLYTQLTQKNNTIYFDATQKFPVLFQNVNVASLTENMRIQFISINNGVEKKDALDAEEDGYWVIHQVEARKFPSGKRATIAKDQRTIIQPEAVILPKNTPEPAKKPKPEKPKREEKPKPQNALALKNRIGISAAAMLNPAKESLNNSMELTLDMGLGKFSLEGLFHFPFKNDLYDDLYGQPSNFVFGAGGGIGGTSIYRYALTSFMFGATYNLLPNDEKVIAPYVQWRLDIQPMKNIGIRLGAMAEPGFSILGDGFESYYRWAIFPGEGGDVFRMNLKIITGLIFWL